MHSSMPIRSLAIAALALSLVSAGAVAQGPASPGAAASAVPGASASAASAGGSPGTERAFAACPIDLDAAAAIAGRALEPSGAYDGAPVFTGETVDGVTTWICGYRVPGDQSASAWNVHLEYAVDASAAARWDNFLQGWLDDTYTDVNERFGVPAYEQVARDEPGKADVSLTLRGPASFVLVGVAAYDTPDSMTQVRPIDDAYAKALLAALTNPTP